MKKIAKLSLVAAVAVAGMTSASAASLEEAIKGVDVSGMVRYRYIDTKTEVGTATATSSQKNDYDIELTAKVPVNDMVKAVIKIDSNQDTFGSGSDSDLALDIEDAYFQFALPYATVNVGKQNIPGPLTDGNQGSGIVALVPAGPVTLAAGYFNNHNTSGVQSKNAMEVAVLGSFGPVNAEAWYADVVDTLDAYSVKVAAKVGPVDLAVQHTSLETDATGSKKNDLTKIEAGASFGIVNVSAAYATTSKYNGDSADGGFGNGAVIDDGSDAAAGFGLEVVDVTALPDADVFVIGANANVTEKINVGVEYLTGETNNHTGTAKVTTDLEELKFSASYAMSKNFKISSYYTIAEEDIQNSTNDTDTTEGRVELKYSF